MASGSYDTTVRVWEAGTGRELAVLRGHPKTVTRVAMTPDGGEIMAKFYVCLSGVAWQLAPTRRLPEPQPTLPSTRLELFWPGGHITLCDTGAYAAVVLVNELIPCKVERPTG
jgi:hypothetical protein